MVIAAKKMKFAYIDRLNILILVVDPIEALDFDHQNIFNNYGSQNGNIRLNQTFNLPDKLIEQYEKRIQQLESEVIFLQALVK